MQYRELGKTGFSISQISFGAWAIGADWGNVDDKSSMTALNRAVDLGINFFDTADVYGDGRSEQLVGKLAKERSETIYIATKLGRRLSPHEAAGFTKQNLENFVERSLKNLQTEAIDLIQLHCPPTQVYYMPEVFDIMDDLVKQGKIRNYGVSVEKVEEAIKAIEYPNVKTVQIIFNMFRQRPAELFFNMAKEKNIGILARVPLASGLLTGKMTAETTFEKNDHRSYNRHGEAFDRGETFSGVDFNTGLKAVGELKKILTGDISLIQLALRWILMHDAVTCAIPGAKNIDQVTHNASAVDIPPLDNATMEKIKNVYTQYIKKEVHQRW